MTILYDYQAFCLQPYGGVSRYFTELITGIGKTEGIDRNLPIVLSNNRHLQEAGIQTHSFFPGTPFKFRESIMIRVNRWHTINKMKVNDYDIFHATYYNPYFLPYLSEQGKRKPSVVTFLDMIHEKYGHQFTYLAEDKRLFTYKRELAQKADRLIAISESTKRDMVDLLDVNPEKIDVIYLGNSFSIPPAVDTPPSSQQNSYLLFVGTRIGYKNFDGMLKAISPTLKREKINLVCVGGGAFSVAEQALIRSLNVADLVTQQTATDATLATLYSNAICFIFPSLYEGFGIPVLESFACNCPCLLSTGGSLPEIGSDAALYFDPNVPDELAAALERLLGDTALRTQLISRGRQRLSLFTWESTVSQTVALYRKLRTATS